MKAYTLFAAFALALPVTAATHQLVKLWETETSLLSVESVRYSAQHKVIFTSNMGPSKSPNAKDGDGSIGKVSLDGKIIDAAWIKGLDAPKGLGIYEGKLYVVDVGRVVVIDVAAGTIWQTIPIASAGGMNDLTVDDRGVAYVSDYRLGKIYRVKDGEFSVFIDDVNGPNGVLAHDNDFYILARGEVLRLQPDHTLKTVVTGLDPSVDGIENITGDEFLVTCSKGIIYEVNVATGTADVLLDQREAGIQTADLDYDARAGILYVPTLFTNQVIAYQLQRSTTALIAGQGYIVPEVGLKMAWIKPGEFTMGSPPEEGGPGSNERQHPVKLTQGFWMGVFETTVDQWSVFAAATGYKTEAERTDGLTKIIRGQWRRDPGSNWRDPGFTQDGNYPVVGISWNDAVAFCRWLTDRERATGRLPANYQYSLPTESEWEYACRAGSTEPHLGDPKKLGASMWLRYGDGLGNIISEPHTHPVGVKRVNAWGLYDVHGNVFEWCRDWFGDYPAGAAVDPTGPVTGTQRILRGGSWHCSAANVRSAFRGRDTPDTRSSSIGFRVSLSAVK
ncbi:MAG: formylglycine-generating enzyme family protein [Opitutaceae bacterium]